MYWVFQNFFGTDPIPAEDLSARAPFQRNVLILFEGATRDALHGFTQ